MLLEENDGLLHWVDELDCLFADLTNISEAGHDHSQQLLLLLGVSLLWDVLDSSLDTVDEFLHVFDASDGVDE